MRESYPFLDTKQFNYLTLELNKRPKSPKGGFSGILLTLRKWKIKKSFSRWKFGGLPAFNFCNYNLQKIRKIKYNLRADNSAVEQLLKIL